MLKTLGLVLLAALALLLIVAATRPDSFRVERSLRIQAPPERLFALINDLKQFNTWNPYEKKDAAIKGRYGPVTQGPGASYAWEGEKVGVGSMTITTATAPAAGPRGRAAPSPPPEGGREAWGGPALPYEVRMKLDFVKPFEAHNQAVFTLRPEAGGTVVSWALHGPSPYVSKLMGLVFNMDRMIGQDFEAGLQNLKALAEKG